jgi:ADP-heptose:LPS heptosyltransferase
MKSEAHPHRILVTRTDRLGDVMLSTPVLRLLKQTHPDAELYFLVQKSWMPVLQYGEAVKLIVYDLNESVDELAAKLRAFQFKRAYVIRDEKKVSWAIWKAKIPERVGPYSTFRSFFLFNRGKFQRRSRCRMHEAEYNLELVAPQIPAQTPADLPRSWVETSESARIAASAFLQSQNLQAKNFYVIHPGSSGSARYVKQEALHALARALVKRGDAVCISGGPREDAIIDEFVKAVPQVKILAKEFAIGLDGMAEVYRQAKVVIAHGTGPLHLAAAVGTPTFAIFSPIFVLSEKRWGPLISPRFVWTPPDVNCPAIYRCIGEKCAYYDCMDRFEVTDALARLNALVQEHSNS